MYDGECMRWGVYDWGVYEVECGECEVRSV